jgi:thiamine biosynthesis protein ThiI
MHLFSGGIDSPVAAWLLMKRGVRPVYLHFYLAPTSEGPIQSKVTKLIKVLSAWGGKSTLVMVPFAEYQLASAEVPGELEPSLFRRFMRMTAEHLAPPFGASAVSTGDSLSQTASQTIWNLGVFDSGSSLPVLRPLLSYDKEEVVGLARRIGTYELSLEEYKDCCAIITRHPRTRTNAVKVAEYVQRLGFGDLISRSLESASLVSYSPKNDEMKIAPLFDVID